jgi:hypothetical protein
MGRLKSSDSRSRNIKVRLNEKEYSMLLDYQSIEGKSFSEFIREAIVFNYNYWRRNH